MSVKDIPDGYAVAYIEGKWYPLEAYRYYSACYQNGFLMLRTFPDWESDNWESDNWESDNLTFRSQGDAIKECQLRVQSEKEVERLRWERLAQKSNVYPERCTHYIDIIEEATGYTPLVQHDYNAVSVTAAPRRCPCCKIRSSSCVSVTALTIEDALQEVAECIYAGRCQCEQAQDERLRMIA